MLSSRLSSILGVVALGLLAATTTACTPREAVIPEKWVVPPPPVHKPRPLPEATGDAASDGEGSLLAFNAKRPATKPEDRAKWTLPTNAKTVIVELLKAAGQDDVELMRSLLTSDARWGIPDRRELRARSVYTHEDPLGVEFLTELRTVTSRLKKRAGFNCQPMQPGWELLVTSGAEPMWCLYQSDDGLDVLAFRLITRAGEPRVDYIGLMAERPEQPIFAPPTAYGYPPPLTPWAKMPASLEPIELMPDGTNPVLEKPEPAAKPAEPEKPVEAPAEAVAPADAEKPAEAPTETEKPAEAKPEKPAEAKPEAKPEKPAEAKPEKPAEAKPEKPAEPPSE